MFFRLLIESFTRQKRRKTLAGIAILLGTTAVTAMLALALSIGDRIHHELAVYGANIVVAPKAAALDVKVGGLDLKAATAGAYLDLRELGKLEGIFWANNITGVSPELDQSLTITKPASGSIPSTHVVATAAGVFFGEKLGKFELSIVKMHPAWELSGRWPTEEGFIPPQKFVPDSFRGEAVLGRALAQRLNAHVDSVLHLSSSKGFDAPVRITGIVSTGDDTDQEILTHWEMVATLTQEPLLAQSVSRIEISARTRPEDAFARMDPDKLSPAKRDIWYCRPYANSIAYQIQEAIPGSRAEQVRRVEQTEGTVLARISGLMWLISAAALLAAGFAVSAAMATAVLERRGEIGLMRSLGASKAAIASLFYAESGLLAVFTGTLGFFAGSVLAWGLGRHIFPADGATPLLNPVLLPVVVAMALLVAIAGSTPSISAALRTDPASTLRGSE